MVPNASDLARRRCTVLGVLRVFAVITWLATTAPIILIVSILAVDGGANEPAGAAFVIGLGGGTVGAILWAFAPWLAEHIVPPPHAHACGRCGYDLRSITEPRCPECGTVLTEEFLPDHIAKGPTSSGLGLERNAQLMVALLARAVGVLLGLAFIAGVVASGLSIVLASGRWGDYETLGALVWLIYCGLGALACVVPVFFPARFARLFVPRGLAHDAYAAAVERDQNMPADWPVGQAPPTQSPTPPAA